LLTPTSHNINIDELRKKIHQKGEVIFSEGRFFVHPVQQRHFPLIKSLYSNDLTRLMIVCNVLPTDDCYYYILDFIIHEFEKTGVSLYVLSDCKAKEEIGIAGLSYINDSKTKIDLSLILLQQYRNKNLGPKIMEMGLKFVFEDLKLDEIYGECLSYHALSQKLMEHVGMLPDGIRDLYSDRFYGDVTNKDSYLTRYKMTKNQYSKRNYIISKKNIHPKARNITAAIKKASEEKDESAKVRKKYLIEHENIISANASRKR
jgi:RimJ/RimL family protein N-acetyltransferase